MQNLDRTSLPWNNLRVWDGSHNSYISPISINYFFVCCWCAYTCVKWYLNDMKLRCLCLGYIWVKPRKQKDTFLFRGNLFLWWGQVRNQNHPHQRKNTGFYVFSAEKSSALNVVNCTNRRNVCTNVPLRLLNYLSKKPKFVEFWGVLK